MKSSNGRNYSKNIYIYLDMYLDISLIIEINFFRFKEKSDIN